MQLKHKDKSYPDIIEELRKVYAQLSKARAVQATAHNSSRPNMETIEEAIREQLARATGWSIIEIDKCPCHGEYLTEDCLSKLEQMGAGEDFFLKAQHLKAILIKNALIKGHGEKEITKEMSAAILDMHREYQDTGKVNATKWLKNQIESSGAEPTRVSGIELFGKPEILKYRPPKNDGSVPKTLTPKEISVRLEELAQRIREIVGRRKEPKADMAHKLGRLTVEMAKLNQETRQQKVKEKGKKPYGYPR